MDHASEAGCEPQESPLASVFTESVPGLLSEVGISLAVSTYQAGFLILLRSQADHLNSHFRSFPRPMGLSARKGRLVLGTQRAVIDFFNMAAAAAKLEPPGSHDACYLPRRLHITGDIDIHEVAWVKDQLWLVNTRFSCLCTLNEQHSFVPRWRPPFVSAYAFEDRCHLNGLAVREGRVRYVTALGAGDARESWRENKARGGVVVDVDSGQTLAAGLSMPHSPRWHDDQLWLLESGTGSLGTVDLATGRYEPLVNFSGFTRGLAFHGPLAFVGLSKVRESDSFGGLPLCQRLKERVCGVSVIHLPSAKEIGFVCFRGSIQEIFSVEVLPHRFPDLLEPSDDLVGESFALPEGVLSEVAN